MSCGKGETECSTGQSYNPKVRSSLWSLAGFVTWHWPNLWIHVGDLLPFNHRDFQPYYTFNYFEQFFSDYLLGTTSSLGYMYMYKRWRGQNGVIFGYQVCTHIFNANNFCTSILFSALWKNQSPAVRMLKKSAISSCFASTADAWLNNNTNKSITIIIIIIIIAF